MFVTGVLPVSIGDQVWFDLNDNGTFDAGEGLQNVDVVLYDAEGRELARVMTSGADANFLFDGLAPGNYRVEVDSQTVNPAYSQFVDPDATLDGMTDVVPLSGTRLDLEFGYRIDPTGYFYNEATGQIIPGGMISVTGPAGITILQNGSTGQYAFTVTQAGTYTILVTPPPGYLLSTTCLDQGTLDPTGQPDPYSIGNGEGAPGFLTSNACTPFYLMFDLVPGDPVVLNNNIPLRLPAGVGADMRVVKSGPALTSPGTAISYTLTVTNLGPDPATGVVLNDPTPAGLMFVTASAPCAGGFPCNLGNMAVNQSISIQTGLIVSNPFLAPVPIVNTALVSAVEIDPNLNNNASAASTTVVTGPRPPTSAPILPPWALALGAMCLAGAAGVRAARRSRPTR